MATAVPAPKLMLIDAHLHHAEAISAVHRLCFDEPWSAFTVRQVLGMPGAFGLLAVPETVNGGAPVDLYGFAISRRAADECELLSLGVAPAHRGQGIGRVLLEATIARARALAVASLFLEVAEDNQVARRLYTEAGFRPIGRRPGYYRRPHGPSAAALTLALILRR